LHKSFQPAFLPRCVPLSFQRGLKNAKRPFSI